uniref:Uncharacterized protein n=1 Tax=Ciona intestinalis TaxID=7719 RepID=H2XT63_CIOIN
MAATTTMVGEITGTITEEDGVGVTGEVPGVVVAALGAVGPIPGEVGPAIGAAVQAIHLALLEQVVQLRDLGEHQGVKYKRCLPNVHNTL